MLQYIVLFCIIMLQYIVLHSTPLAWNIRADHKAGVLALLALSPGSLVLCTLYFTRHWCKAQTGVLAHFGVTGTLVRIVN